MREYEMTAIYDLAVQEQGGQDASVQALTTAIEARGGKILKVDHWGRRRMAYPIGKALDGDYIITRFELEPAAVSVLEAALRIDEKVFRHLVVRADELPVPLPPREPRRDPNAPPPTAPAPVAEAAAPEAEAAAADTAASEPAIAEPVAEEPTEAAAAGEPESTPAPAE